jgi:hypothetical protein
MSGSQYKIMTLDQPWGDSEETAVRIFPPCQVESTYHHGKDVIVWTVSTRGTLRRKRIDGYYGPYPTNGFVAWDDKNGEYAWHEVGSIDVPSAKDPDVPKFTPIIRGETETVVMGAGSPRDRLISRGVAHARDAS